jgi:hypothetical protein
VIEPTDGEAAEPGPFTAALNAKLVDWYADQVWGETWKSMTVRLPVGFFHREVMPEFTLFPRIAAVEQFVGRQRLALVEARRRVNTAVDVLLHGDTGDW